MKRVYGISILLSVLLVGSCKQEELTPISTFTFTGDNKPATCEVTFTNSSANATSYLWEFGDGAASTDKNVKHSYTTGGTFTVKLTATGIGGNHTSTKSVVILNPIPNPVSNFNFTEIGNFAPSKIIFVNSASNAESYSWNFGDGQTSTSQNPNHIYLTGGTYNVTLISTNSIGVQNAINKIVTIKNSPTQLKINSIELISFPATTPTGGGWDPYDGPDVFPIITQSSGDTSYKSYRKENLLNNYLPATYTSGFPLTITSLDFANTIVFYDYDLTSSNEWIGGYYFTVRDYMPVDGNPYPTIINFQDTTSDLKFTINVEWAL